MPVAKLVGYTLLANVGLVAALGAIHSDDTTAAIEVGDFYFANIQTFDPPPDEDTEHSVWQRTLRIGELDGDPAIARARAIEEARSGSIFDSIEPDVGDMYRPQREAPLPRRAVSLGRITSSGDLDRVTIRRYMNHHIDKIEACYERELLARPSFGGTIVVRFVILPTGSVKDSRGEGFDATVARCVGDVVGTIAFPRQSDGIVEVSYPLRFRRN
jgi:hypothetical protein